MPTIKRISFISIFLTAILIGWGGLLGTLDLHHGPCLPWPFCGEDGRSAAWPIQKGHRVLGLILGIFQFILFYKARKVRDLFLDNEGPSPLLLIGIIIIQGLLGILTVAYGLPKMVSVGHFLLSMMFFYLVIKFHHQLKCSLSPYKKDLGPFLVDTRHYKKIFGQIVQFSSGSIIISLTLFLILFTVGFNGSLSPMSWDSLTRYYLGLFEGKIPFPSLTPISFNFLAIVTIIFNVSLLLSFILCVKCILYFKKNFYMGNKSYFNPARWNAIGTLLLGAFFVSGQYFLVTGLREDFVINLFIGVLTLGLLIKLGLFIQTFERKLFPEGKTNFISDLLDLTKPKLSFLVMITSLVGIFLSPHTAGIEVIFSSLIGTYFVVSGACALNCYIEREIDGKMERTKNRALPAGRMRANTALIFGVALLLIGFPLLYFKVNFLTALLGAIATIFYLFIYTPWKQKGPFAVFIGAIPGAMPPLMGWTTMTGELGPLGISLFAILFVWQLPHFMAISIYCAKDYLSADIKVYPNQKGEWSTRKDIILWTFILAMVSLLPYYWANLSPHYKYASFLINGLFIYLALVGLKIKSDLPQLRVWAKKYFWGSLAYLPIILGAILFLK